MGLVTAGSLTGGSALATADGAALFGALGVAVGSVLGGVIGLVVGLVNGLVLATIERTRAPGLDRDVVRRRTCGVAVLTTLLIGVAVAHDLPRSEPSIRLDLAALVVTAVAAVTAGALSRWLPPTAVTAEGAQPRAGSCWAAQRLPSGSAK